MGYSGKGIGGFIDGMVISDETEDVDSLSSCEELSVVMDGGADDADCAILMFSQAANDDINDISVKKAIIFFKIDSPQKKYKFVSLCCFSTRGTERFYYWLLFSLVVHCINLPLLSDRISPTRTNPVCTSPKVVQSPRSSLPRYRGEQKPLPLPRIVRFVC